MARPIALSWHTVNRIFVRVVCAWFACSRLRFFTVLMCSRCSGAEVREVAKVTRGARDPCDGPRPAAVTGCALRMNTRRADAPMADKMRSSAPASCRLRVRRTSSRRPCKVASTGRTNRRMARSGEAPHRQTYERRWRTRRPGPTRPPYRYSAANYRLYDFVSSTSAHYRDDIHLWAVWNNRTSTSISGGRKIPGCIAVVITCARGHPRADPRATSWDEGQLSRLSRNGWFRR